MSIEASMESPAINEPMKTDKESLVEEKTDKPEKAVVSNEEVQLKNGQTKVEDSGTLQQPKKPLVFKVDWKEDQVYLYQSSRTPQIPNISPQELKLESWLKFHGIPYENVNHNAKLTSKKGSLPFIELNGEEVADADIIETLAEKFGKEMPAKLSQEQKSVEHAMIKMVENHIYWAIMDWRTNNVDNILKAYKIHLPTYLVSKAPLAALNLYFRFVVCKKAKKKVKSQELENVEMLGKNDLKVLRDLLGEKEFVFGNEPSLLDLVVFSQLAQLIMVEEDYPCTLRDFLQAECKNLVGLHERMREKCWGGHWELATGDTLEGNPHLPKSAPEEKGEVNVEVNEKEVKPVVPSDEKDNKEAKPS